MHVYHVMVKALYILQYSVTHRVWAWQRPFDIVVHVGLDVLPQSLGGFPLKERFIGRQLTVSYAERAETGCN